MDFGGLVGALRHFRRIRALKTGKSIHSQLIKLGLSYVLYFANNMMSLYVDCNLLTDAYQLFEEMPKKNMVTWSTMVSASANGGEPEVALRLYHRMLASKSEMPNEFIYSGVLKACGLLGDLDLGKMIHNRISEKKMGSDTVLMNSLLDMYVKCRSIRDARNVFDSILQKTSVSWNTIISGYCKEDLMEEALNLFYQMPERNIVSWNSIIAGFADRGTQHALEFVTMMHREGFKLDVFTLPCALKTCSSLQFVAFGKQCHGFVIRSGLDRSSFSASALIDMYSHCNELEDAQEVFDEYTSFGLSLCDSLALYNSLLSGYVVCGQNDAALGLLSQIHRTGLTMDSYTFSSGLKACINLLNLRFTLQLHGLVVTSGYELDCIVGSILVDVYAKHADIENALKLFNLLPEKDIVAWSGLIMGCTTMGYNLFAFSLFRDMIISNIDVDEYVVSCIIKACSSLASSRCGKQIHAFCVKSGYLLEEFTVTSLIDMYSKCGDIEDSLELFNNMLVRDTVSWTGIIVGCGQNGRAKEAIRLYYEMLQTGLKPNELTFFGILSACRHAGLIEEAKAIFYSMESEHGLKPHYEHYYCMVDLLGQLMHFDEAEKLIASMPFKPDRTIWCSLLVACGNHRNAELADRIAEKLLAFAPEDPSIYVTLSNVYATLGMWENLSTVRNALKKVGAKEAGRSWVEIS